MKEGLFYGENLVICDCEEQYAKNLLQVWSSLHQTQFSLYLFYTIEDLKKFSELKSIDRLLISDVYPKIQRDEISAKKKFILLKEKQVLSGDEIGIFRYQSAESIWKKMQDQGLKVEKAGKIKSSSIQIAGKLIGIYSPVHRIGKTRFALEMGKQLAEKEPVLYLNLEAYAGGSGYFPVRQNQNLGDLLYYSRQEQMNLGMRISMMVGQLGKLDYIEPIFFVQDLKGVKGGEWTALLTQIMEQSIYEKIIVDLGESVDGLFEILKMCDVIYTPYIEDKISKMKLTQYTENLRKTGLEDIIEKTIQKKMTSRKEIRSVQEKGVREKR